ncbi:MAG: BrnA antitoxin family protein [Phyllobacteriaceae bacterium]|nr:BrnA antitoxin family protein [Phyllobacteriaceae bacterium]
MNVKSTKPRFSRPLTAQELAALPDETIDYSDIPATDVEFWKDAKVEFAPFAPKKSVTIRYDAEVIEWFKANASKDGKRGRGYQTAMNAVLKAYVKAQKG